MSFSKNIASLLIIVNLFAGHSEADDYAYDVVIRGGRIVDGTGSPWYVADVGVRDGTVAKIGRIDAQSASQVIDAEGLIVAPGFIDMMGQTATPMLRDPSTAINLLTQGITTINAGEGYSAAPLGEPESESLGWQTMAEYFHLLEQQGMPVNVVQTVGHTQVRELVMGEDDRRPSEDELQQMRLLVREAMEAGAIGVSTALIYPPAVYATTEEIAELTSVAGEYGGRYYTHMRNEGDQLLEAIDEALEIGRIGKTPVHIFHLKAAGQQNWGKMQLAIARIKAARSDGQQVTADIYPYINNGLGIDAFIHPRHFGQGRARLISRLDSEELRAEIRKEIESTSGWENWFRHVGYDWNKVIVGQTNDQRYRELAGQSVADMAKANAEEPWDTFFNLVRAGSFALPQSMTDANKIVAMRQEFVSFCTDVGPAGGSRSATHPRAFGSFTRMLSRYVRDLGVISLEQAIARASAGAANDVLAYDRGRIAVGLAADIVVFDFDQLADRATFSKPHELSEGMRHVLVNGEVALSDGEFTGERSGRVLRGPGYDANRSSQSVVSGDPSEAFAHIDELMQRTIAEHRAAGASLAISDQGRLVYARGYGYADIGSRTPVVPSSLFRIASISKPITSVAILRLVDQGKLSLDDKVFEILEYEPHLEDDSEYDERTDEITIRHLLQHRGGWDRNKSFDAMFRSVDFAKSLRVDPPAGTDTIIRVMLGKPLDFDPGHRYAYSNYGYCLLGRVIEKLSGESYEQSVKMNVLAPLGVTAMRIGATHLAGRADGEVRYYDPASGSSVFAKNLAAPVPHPYGAWYLEAMDSHGAWIASASDLVRFAGGIDSPEDSPLLSADTTKLMFERPAGLAGHDDQGKPKSKYYGLGWSVQVGDYGRLDAGHGGSLPGTNTQLVRRGDGRNYAILFNTRTTPHTSRIVSAVLPELDAAIDEVQSWPIHDLFDDVESAD